MDAQRGRTTRRRVGPALRCGLLTVPLCALLLGACSPQKELKGIVLISVDTLRADHLGCYGYSRPTSPFIDQLAANGVLFEQAISSSSWTLPSHATMLTGLYPSTHRAVDASSTITPSAVTAAELLRKEGFATGAVVTSWFVSANYGFNRGFDWFQDLDKTTYEKAGKTVDAPEVVALAEEWLESNAGERFFLFLHLYDTHYTYIPPPPYQELFATDYKGPRRKYRSYKFYKKNPLRAERIAYEMSQYDGEIRFVDDQLRRFHRILERLDLLENTLVVVTSDHGEEFGERGSWGHGHTLFEEQVRVPLIFSGAGVAGARSIAQQVGHVDLLPTILAMAGISPPEGLHGRSLAPLLRGVDAKSTLSGNPGRPVLTKTSRFHTNQVALRHQGWKLILDLAKGQEMLFELSEDPGEQVDLSADRPETLSRLRSETVSALGALIPDRWNLTWSSEVDGELTAKLETNGAILEALTLQGTGQIEISEDLRRISYRLPANETLSWKTLPVDAQITFSEPPMVNGSEVRLIIDGDGESSTSFPVTLSLEDAAAAGPDGTEESPAAVLWVDSRQGVSESVTMRRADRRRLKALGYIVD